VRAFGGRAEVAGVLASRAWHTVGMHATDAGEGGHPVRLERGVIVADAGLLSRAQGCLLGQIGGDSLGALVEFRSREDVVAAHPSGPRTLADGGVWDTLAGQPTDDSEMALALARAVVSAGGFDAKAVLQAYEGWLRSSPFDVGTTVREALLGRPVPESQANGSLMRASPIGVLGHALPAAKAAEVARQDSALTHPNPVCGDAVGAFVVATAHAIRAGDGAEGAWEAALQWAGENRVSALVREGLLEARREPPVCDGGSQGWVRIALQNAFYELLHAPNVEEGVVATVRRGGDADTNAAVAGALLGAVHGRRSVPEAWRSAILSCRPAGSRSHRPRPRRYWPTDVLEIAERLLLAGAASPPAARQKEVTR
jgi:ADP-ribosyl-[dinitrogen reductase] hydrolase